MSYSSSLLVCFIALLSIGDEIGVTKPPWCFSFSLSSPTHGTHRLSGHSRRGIKLWAKPPPISNFDLASIEAFEAVVDSEEALDSTTDGSTPENTDDGSPAHQDDSIKTISVPDKLKGKRIDTVLSAIMEPKLSRSACGNMIADGCVKQIAMKGGKEVEVLLNRKAFKVEAGMTLRVKLPKTDVPTEIVAQNLPLQIIYEDEHMIVINKAAGMVVHPAAGNWDGTVVNALAYYLANDSPHGTGDFVDNDGESDTNANMSEGDGDGDGEVISLRPGIVHRLDKGTTGILIVSKTKDALSKLSESFAARKVKKTYLAVTVGNPGKRVAIDKPIGRHPVHRQKMRVVPDPHRNNYRAMAKPIPTSPSQAGRRALSFVDTLQFDGKLSLVRVRIETGRTHQIRVHLQDRHTPIYGDDVYGISDWNKRLLKAHGIERPLLHAHKLEIGHPITGEHMVFHAPMAEDMISVAKGIWPDGQNELPEAYRKV